MKIQVRHVKQESVKVEIGGMYRNRLDETVKILYEQSDGTFVAHDGSLYTEGGLCQPFGASQTCKCLLARIDKNSLHERIDDTTFNSSNLSEIIRLLRKIDDLSKNLKIKFTADFG